MGMLAATGSAWAAAPRPMHLVTPVTDNYKASYNADPAVRERRTWLVVSRVRARGLGYEPPRPPALVITPSADLLIRGSTGRSAMLRARPLDAGLDLVVFRVDADGEWGLLASIADPAALAARPIRVRLTVTAGGTLLGSSIVTYRSAPEFAAVPNGHIEHNGPGGRWHVGSTGTRANWEAGRTSDTAPPAIISLSVPAATDDRTLAVRSVVQDDMAVTQVRFRLGARRFAAWRPWTSRLGYRLPPRVGSALLSMQVRDGAGRRSNIATRTVKCTNGCASAR